MERLSRKIDHDLLQWKADPYHLPLIVKGARQIGKTESIRHFGKENYENYIEINFITNPAFRSIFANGYSAEAVIKNISFLNPTIQFIPGKTLLFFDELQACPDCATSLKFFREDGQFDVICSGSLMGINYKEIESNSVGSKMDYTMFSLDFEEYLWALGYQAGQIEDLYQHMLTLEPLPDTVMKTMLSHFQDYMITGGMPAIVSRFMAQKNFSGILQMQEQILTDYKEDITKYAGGLDQGRILNVYNHIPVFLGQENKKFRISKVARGARSREYVGVSEWLSSAGIVNICYCMQLPELPLKGNYIPNDYKLYFADTGLLIGSLDEEAQADLRENRNFNAYKEALYENVVAEVLVKQGLPLFFYRNTQSTLEIDFMVRDIHSLVPIEVKANDNPTPSLNRLIGSDKYHDIQYGIKLCRRNIGFNGKFYTFPYFLAFLLKRFLKERKK
ncbi:MAG: ATP-binding protein [Eubacterium sp.]|nr:ATP-binding protein [Eubacterium sp.]